MKILVLVLNEVDHDNRVLKESLSLKNMGFSVRILSVSYQEEPINTTINNVDVTRILLKSPKYIFYKKGKANTIQLLIIYTEMLLRYILKLCFNLKDFNVLHCNDLHTLPIGVFYKIFINKKAKIIYDCHEYETERFLRNCLPKLLAKFTERTLIKFADHLITVSDSIANEYVKLYNITKPKLIYNCPYYKNVEKKNIFREKFNIAESDKIFLYQGGLYPGRGIDLLLNTFKSVPRDYKLVFLGYGPLTNKIINSQKTTENIFYHKAVSLEDLYDYTSSADYGFSLIEDLNLNFKYCLPNKLFEYIICKIPVIVSNLPEMSNFIKEYQIGCCAEDYSPESIKNSMDKIIRFNQSELKINLEKTARIFNWQNQETTLSEIYNNL